MLQYLFESWAWSVGGFGVGYLLGRTERDLRIIKRKLGARDDDT